MTRATPLYPIRTDLPIKCPESCAHCGGSNIITEADQHGSYFFCLSCGWSVDRGEAQANQEAECDT